MQYKMLVLDIDGTLTNSQKEITPATRQALYTIQKHGVRVAIASGRPTPGTRMAANAISLAEFNNFVLSFNGAKITNCGTGKIVFEQVLPNKLIPEIYRTAIGYGLGLISYEGEDVIAATPIDPYMGLEVDHRLQKQFGQNLSIYRSEPYFLELMPPGVDKAKSLEKLLAALSLTREETVCCGDGFNDLSMIEYAGLGVAMKNAQRSVRECADYITATNDEDGIVQVVENFFGDFL